MGKVINALILIGILGIVVTIIFRLTGGAIALGAFRANAGSVLLLADSLILAALGLKQLTK